MAVQGCDSRPPSDASIAAARAAGVRLWAGYIGDAGDGIDPGHEWSKSDFDRVKNAGLATFAYVSGNQDPATIRARGAAYGVRICVDVERLIRPDGAWVQAWLDASGAGLYGNLGVHRGRRAAFYIVADYPYVVPTTPSTWVPGATLPPGPHGWQYRGTHENFGASIDAAWFDEWFAPAAFSGGLGELSSTQGEDMVLFHDPASQAMYVVDATGKRHIDAAEFHALQVLGIGRVANQPGGYADMAAAELAVIPDSPPKVAAPAPAGTFDPTALIAAVNDAKAAAVAAQASADAATKAAQDASTALKAAADAITARAADIQAIRAKTDKDLS